MRDLGKAKINKNSNYTKNNLNSTISLDQPLNPYARELR